MAFHTAIWVDNYMTYVAFLNDLSTVSNPQDYNPVEYIDMHPGAEARTDSMVETHNYFPGNQDDVDLWSYMSKQFAWGKKIQTYLRHPTDDNKDGKATKNVMSRWSTNKYKITYYCICLPNWNKIIYFIFFFTLKTPLKCICRWNKQDTVFFVSFIKILWIRNNLNTLFPAKWLLSSIFKS